MGSNIRVWKFGCKPPINSEIVRDQLYAADVYYNKLIELEYQKRQAIRDLQRSYFPELADLEDKIDKVTFLLVNEGEEKLRKTLRKERSSLSKSAKEMRATAGKELKSGYTELRKRTKGLPPNCSERAARIEQMLEEDWPQYWKDRVRIERKFLELTHEARKSVSGSNKKALTNRSGKIVEHIMHGTYELCERSAVRAWKDYGKILSGQKKEVDPATRAKAAERGHPRFRKFDGSGVLRIQLDDSRVSISEANEAFSIGGQWLQIDLGKKRDWSPRSKIGTANVAATPGSKRQIRKTLEPGWGLVRVRVGSDKNRKPIWAELPTYVHRPIPYGASIKWAAIAVKRYGPRLRYELQLTLETECERLPTGKGVAAINFGWRTLGNSEYRVAYLVDDSGYKDSLTLDRDFGGRHSDRNPNRRRYSVVGRLAYVDDLQSNSAVHFDEVRDALKRWVKSHKISDELKMHTSHIAQWRNPAKLVMACKIFISETGFDTTSILSTWKDERLAIKADLFDSRANIESWCLQHGIKKKEEQFAVYLVLWMVKQSHLYTWQENQRKKAIRRRKDLFLCWVKNVCRKYEKILVEDYDLTEVTSACKKEREEDRQTKLARKNRSRSAPGEARQMLIAAAGNKAVMQGTESPGGSGASQRCTKCGRSSQVDLRSQIVVTCPCGHAEDQDLRNCTNRLMDYLSKSEAT